MKKLLSLLLLLSTLILMPACESNVNKKASSDDVLDYNNDFQYYYSNINGLNSSITKSDTGYYIFLQNRFLYYIDKETMEATPLCSKVNCTHKDKTVCDAYFNTYSVPWSNGNTIQYNNNRLYILIRNEDNNANFKGTSLYSVSPDGTERKEIISFKYGFENWLIHRGYFYYITVEYCDDIDYSAEKSFKIYRLPVDKFNSEPQIVFDSSNYCDYITGGAHQLLAYDNYILTAVNPISEQEMNKLISGEENISLSNNRKYFTVETENLSANEIANKNGEVYMPRFYNGSLLYHILKDDSFVYYTSELDGSNPELIKEMKYSDNIFSDGSHLYMQNIDELFNEKLKGEKLYILNPDFSKSNSAILPVNKFSLNNIAQDPDYFIFIHYLEQENLSGDFEIRCIDKSQLNNMDGKEADYKVVYSSKNTDISTGNSVDQIDTSVKINTDDEDLKNCFENAQKQLYKISSDYDDSLDKNISGGFTVNMSWYGDGGEYTANFQILKFNTQAEAEAFLDKNPYSFLSGNYVAFASIEQIPVEIKDMLISIIENKPVKPIDSKDFSGEIFTFS